MGASIDRMIEDILDNFNHSVDGIRASVVATSDGLPIASAMREDTDLAMVAALGAAIMGSSKSAVTTLRLKEYDNTMINAVGGKIVVTAFSMACLIVVLEPTANTGLVLIALNDVKKKISQIIGE
jgi:predicted regulator of Ras-like GTPase activity (Roadblock/LC7/MglB family)